MRGLNVELILKAWATLAGSVSVPHNDDEYKSLVSLLDNLIDEIGEDESHPLASMMEVVGVIIEKYEDEHVPELNGEYSAVGNRRQRPPMRRNEQQLLIGSGARQSRGNPEACSH